MKNRICTNFALCKPVANINLAKVCTHCVSGGCQVCTFCANLATTTYAMGANLYKVDTCNRFAQGKVCANSIFHPVYVKTWPITHRVARIRKPIEFVQPYIETLKKENQKKIMELKKEINSLQEQLNLAKTQMEDEIVQRLEHEGKLCFKNCASLAIRWICNNKIKEKFPGCAAQLKKIITVHAYRNEKLVNKDLECGYFMETLVNLQIAKGIANCLIVDEMMDVQITAAWEKLMTVDGSVVIFATLQPIESGVPGHVVVYDLDTRTERTKDGKVMMCDPKDPNDERYKEMDFQEFKKQVVGCDELRLYSVNLDKLCEIIVENKDYLHDTEKTFYNAPPEN